MKKLLLLSLILAQIPGCGEERPDGWDVANDFMNKWWEYDVFGVWEFSPPSTFHVYEDGQGPPFDLEVFDGGECWTIKWGSIEETVCPCSF